MVAGRSSSRSGDVETVYEEALVIPRRCGLWALSDEMSGEESGDGP